MNDLREIRDSMRQASCQRAAAVVTGARALGTALGGGGAISGARGGRTVGRATGGRRRGRQTRARGIGVARSAHPTDQFHACTAAGQRPPGTDPHAPHRPACRTPALRPPSGYRPDGIPGNAGGQARDSSGGGTDLLGESCRSRSAGHPLVGMRAPSFPFSRSSSP
jgi:hypothetical protein